MRGIIIILLAIASYNFQAVLTENDKSKIHSWFQMKIHSDINKECESNTNYTIDLKIYRNYQSILEQFWEPLYYQDVEKFDYVLKNVYNLKMIEKLKELINLIQGCLVNEKQLDPDELVAVIDRILAIHAKRVLQLNPEMVGQMGGCRFIINSKLWRKCEKGYKSILIDPLGNDVTLFQFLTGSTVSSSSCQEILPLEQCFMTASAPCNPSARKVIKLLLSPPDTEKIICEEFLQETESNRDDHVNDFMTQEFSLLKKRPPLFRVQ